MADNEVVPGGIVPPWMSEDWRTMRARLTLAGAHCYAAAEANITEDVRAQTGMAMAELLDAIFMLGRIERKDDPGD
jgi:hypothetical protein